MKHDNGADDSHHLSHHHVLSSFGFISNATLSGANEGCKFFAKYETTGVSSFQMCVGQKPVDLKNGMSIINLIQSRGYLPTCRVLHFMLWMQSEVNGKDNKRDTFLDIGANIGSCSTHIASLGYPVISAEPVTEHVKTIQGFFLAVCATYTHISLTLELFYTGTIDTNPSFHIDLNQIGISSEEKTINVSFGHGARNWGASIFEEDRTANAQMALDLKTG